MIAAVMTKIYIKASKIFLCLIGLNGTKGNVNFSTGMIKKNEPTPRKNAKLLGTSRARPNGMT